MSLFDRVLTYQLGLMWQPHAEPLNVDTRVLANALSAPPDEGPAFGLKLRGQPDQLMGVLPVYALSSSSGIWRFTIQPTRIDVVFDARGYMDLVDGDVTLEQIRKRVAANLVTATALVGVEVSRAALIVTGEVGPAALANPAAVVARRFFSEAIGKMAAEERVPDLGARLNTREQWTLDGLTLDINQIEAGNATWNVVSGAVERSLAWQFDINTTPANTAPLSAKGAFEFFEKGTRWIEASLLKLEELCKPSR